MWKTILAAAFLLAGTTLFAQETGLASYYADKYQGNKTASGELYDRTKMTAAHKTLPFGTRVLVTRLDNNLSTEVTINDRGPRPKNRVIDLSGLAAEQLDMVGAGLVKVRVDVVPDTPPVVVDPAPTPVPNPATPAPTVATSPETVTGTELYEVEVRRRPKTGYGVQIAYLSNYESALEMVEQLQTKVSRKVLLNVGPGKTEGTKAYRVIIGSFDTHDKATAYKAKLLQDQNMEGFVVSLSKM